MTMHEKSRRYLLDGVVVGGGSENVQYISGLITGEHKEAVPVSREPDHLRKIKTVPSYRIFLYKCSGLISCHEGLLAL